MEATIEFSSKDVRSKIAAIEAIELALLGFGFWCFGAIVTIPDPDFSFLDRLIFFVITEGILLGSWVVYNVYIRVARAGGRFADVGLWVVATVLTSTYTFWAWSILDLNRFLVARRFYRGKAPIEYAWSIRSKQIRKVWEKTQKALKA